MKTASLATVLGFVRRLAVTEGRVLTDCELLERFVERRDEAAFTELVRRHGPKVLAACRRVLRQEQDAEDVFQAAFLVLARRAGAIRHGETVGGWLYQVAYRLALRARQIGTRRREQAMTSLDSASVTVDPLSLDDELAQLPEPYRAVVVLCYLEGHSQFEAARILETTTDAVNSRLKRARDLLRGRYARLGAAALPVLTSDAIAATARIALHFAVQPTSACGASPLALTLAKGAIPMIGSSMKMFAAAVCIAAMLTIGLFAASPSMGDEQPADAQLVVRGNAAIALEPIDKSKPQKGCIILWMSGGPSQIDTFDPKAGEFGLFKVIDTNVKGLQFSETLPRLAKQAHHLAVIRSMNHREGDHMRGSYLMQTAQAPGGALTYPRLGSLLGRELGDALTTLPRFVAIDSANFRPGFLGEGYAPLRVGGKGVFLPPPPGPEPALPAEADFEALDKENGKAMRKNLVKAFDLADEKAATRDAYGRGRFGNSVLLARRLRETGVPVIEVALGGWDTHGVAVDATKRVAEQVDAVMSSLIKDLDDRKLLDRTLIVWMGEFGRTPRVNGALGRDHYPQAFSVVLAGAGIKGGQAIGKTSADGFKIEERPVSVPELHATIYQALGIDSAKKYRVPDVGDVHVLEKGTKAVQEALR